MSPERSEGALNTGDDTEGHSPQPQPPALQSTNSAPMGVLLTTNPVDNSSIDPPTSNGQEGLHANIWPIRCATSGTIPRDMQSIRRQHAEGHPEPPNDPKTPAQTGTTQLHAPTATFATEQAWASKDLAIAQWFPSLAKAQESLEQTEADCNQVIIHRLAVTIARLEQGQIRWLPTHSIKNHHPAPASTISKFRNLALKWTFGRFPPMSITTLTTQFGSNAEDALTTITNTLQSDRWSQAQTEALPPAVDRTATFCSLIRQEQDR